MAKKVTTGIIAAVLMGAIALFAGAKAQEKKAAEKPAQKAEQQLKAGECTKHHENLLDQLVKAYEANDRGKMGEIIKKMQQRREKMREFAKFNKWHRRAHRGSCGEQGRTRGMAGPGWHHGRGMCGCCPAGRGGWQGGPPCQRPCGRGGMGAWEPPAGQCRPMRGCKPGARAPENEQQSQDARPMDDPPEADW